MDIRFPLCVFFKSRDFVGPAKIRFPRDNNDFTISNGKIIESLFSVRAHPENTLLPERK